MQEVWVKEYSRDSPHVRLNSFKNSHQEKFHNGETQTHYMLQDQGETAQTYGHSPNRFPRYRLHLVGICSRRSYSCFSGADCLVFAGMGVLPHQQATYLMTSRQPMSSPTTLLLLLQIQFSGERNLTLSLTLRSTNPIPHSDSFVKDTDRQV